MKWRVSLTVIFDDYETAKKVYDFLAGHGRLMRTIRKGEPAEEKSVVMLERHFHDEDPAKPCEIIEKFESE